MRPTLSRGAFALLANAAAIYMAALATGADWLFVLVSALIGILVVGAIWPFMLLRRGLRPGAFEVHPQPLAIVGEDAVAAIVSNGPRSIRLRQGDSRPWSVPTPERPGTATSSPLRRGVFASMAFEVACSAPLGIVSWHALRTYRLESPHEVGPRPLPAQPGALEALADASTSPRSNRSLEQVRGLRDYRHRDPVRHVHWPASARRDRLMVKEFEGPACESLNLVVDLGDGGEPGERIAQRAAGLAELAVREGIAVRLVTHERDGATDGRVASSREIAQRLARCVPGIPGAFQGSGLTIELAP